jgi:hypothetical protein
MWQRDELAPSTPDHCTQSFPTRSPALSRSRSVSLRTSTSTRSSSGRRVRSSEWSRNRGGAANMTERRLHLVHSDRYDHGSACFDVDRGSDDGDHPGRLSPGQASADGAFHRWRSRRDAVRCARPITRKRRVGHVRAGCPNGVALASARPDSDRDGWYRPRLTMG